jgi:integrase
LPQKKGGLPMAKLKGIYKRGGIYWIRYAGPDGRIRFESAKTTSQKEAECLLTCRKKEVQEGNLPEIKKIAKNITFRELAVEYLEWVKRQRAFVSKKCRVLQLVGFFGNHPLNSFSTQLVEKYQSGRLVKNKPASVNKTIAIFKHMLAKAVEWEMMSEEILKKVRKVKQIPENNKRLRFLASEECQALIKACDPHIRPIVVTALNTGMRRGEILNLKWDQIDLKHGFILLEVTKNGERREIPINETLRRTLETLPRHIKGPYVFWHGEEGKPYGELKKSFKSALKRAGIRDFTFHDLRHCFASHLVMAGCDLKTVQELLGHKTLTMTLRYAHLAPGHKVKAVGILDEVLSEKINYTKTIQFAKNKGSAKLLTPCNH